MYVCGRPSSGDEGPQRTPALWILENPYNLGNLEPCCRSFSATSSGNEDPLTRVVSVLRTVWGPLLPSYVPNYPSEPRLSPYSPPCWLPSHCPCLLGGLEISFTPHCLESPLFSPVGSLDILNVFTYPFEPPLQSQRPSQHHLGCHQLSSSREIRRRSDPSTRPS
jgi:hypothetical protein